MRAVKNELRLEVGRAWVWTEEIEKMRTGTTVELEGEDDSTVSLYLNGKLVAKGNPVVVEGNIAIEVTEIIDVDFESGLYS